MSVVKSKKALTWKNLPDVGYAKKLVDLGYLLPWSDGKAVVKVLGEQGSCDLVRYVAVRLGDRYSDRLSAEILVETLYAILTAASSEKVMIAFLEELFDSDHFENVTRHLVEISLGGEVGEDDLSKAVVAAAVALICEIGLNIQRIEEDDPGRIEKAKALGDHVAAYLLSVSNTNVQAVRLSLLRYFSQTEYGLAAKTNYTRLMVRFGHSIMESLFQQLFVKKSERVAVQYLLENLPCALEAGSDTQKILHETFKQHMLKQSERFCLFMHELGSHLISLGTETTLCPAGEAYARHLIALYKVTSDLGHKELGREVLQELHKFTPFGSICDWVVALETSSEIRRAFRELAHDYRVKVVQAGKAGKVVSQFRMSKRGRKPSLSKGDYGFLEQVTTLGDYEVRHSA
jgi:hypothetical protein